MSDLNAIREDIAMAARSAEMCRHVALDHAPELVDRIELLTSDVGVLARQREALWDALEQILHVGLNDGMEWDTVERIVKDGPGKFDVLALLERLDPSPRCIETAEELDALPDRTVIRDTDEWVFEKLNQSNDGTGESFWAAPAIDSETSDWEIEPVLPATVLWTPEGEQ